MSRQLGLGVSRVVIDPGHGGHDPGALGKGLNEADLVLDVALRLEKLLADEPGLEVTLTRRTNVYIPLEERTAIANRLNADLFISIHANASRNKRGDRRRNLLPELCVVTRSRGRRRARELRVGAGDASPARHHSRRLRSTTSWMNRAISPAWCRSRWRLACGERTRTCAASGVKKAPFVVLIGAAMPSVLAEISFVTNPQELQLLKTAAYKDRIAEALEAAVLRYRRSLKGSNVVATGGTGRP